MRVSPATSMQSDINVTPLVDVCLVLLIIFMVVTPMMVGGVPVQLPRAQTAVATGEATRQLAVTVKGDGTIYAGALAIRRDQLASVLDDLHRREPSRTVVVRADRHILYGRVVEVLDACRHAGYADVGLATQRP